MKSNNDYGKEFVINKNARKTISKGQIRTQTRQRRRNVKVTYN